jgi:cytidine deaminase
MPQRLHLDIWLDLFSEAELAPEHLALLQAARQACQTAHAPYSNFWVGAALQLANDQLITGSNQENAAYPSGLCAERVALFAAGATWPGVPGQMLAVTARRPGPPVFLAANPCGACRQVMAEYENLYGAPLQIIMEMGQGQVAILPSARGLLPWGFHAGNLA